MPLWRESYSLHDGHLSQGMRGAQVAFGVQQARLKTGVCEFLQEGHALPCAGDSGKPIDGVCSGESVLLQDDLGGKNGAAWFQDSR